MRVLASLIWSGFAGWICWRFCWSEEWFDTGISVWATCWIAALWLWSLVVLWGDF